MDVPERSRPQVKAFCKRVSSQKPRYVPVQPTAHAEINECFAAVPEQVRREGGEQLVGWALWEWPGVLIEAEFHAVWRSPAGSLIDITPKDTPAPHILFLPDTERQYEGVQVDNIRQPLSEDPLVALFIHLAGERYRLMNEGDLAGYHGHMVASPELVEVIEAMQNTQLELLRRYGPASAMAAMFQQ